MNRASEWYLALVSAAFMIGIGQIWLFPGLMLKYGIGFFIAFTAAMLLLAGGAMAAVRTTQLTRYDLPSLYREELRNRWASTLFMWVSIFTMSFISIIAGWFITSAFLGAHAIKTPEGALISGLIAIALTAIVTYRGKISSWDSLIFAYLFFVGSIIITAVALATSVPAPKLGGSATHIVGGLLQWKGLPLSALKTAVEISIHMMGVGFGFWLVFGLFLPDEYSPRKLVLTSTVITLVLTFIVAVTGAIVLHINHNAPHNIVLAVTAIPALLKKFHLGIIAWIFTIGMFLGALKRMFPLTEIATESLEDIAGINRSKALPVVLAVTTIIAIANAITIQSGSIFFLKDTMSVLLPFTAIVELLPAIVGKDYIPEYSVWIARVTAVFLLLLTLHNLAVSSMSTIMAAVLILTVAGAAQFLCCNEKKNESEEASEA